MKPISLSLSAFGPYAEPVTIDFEKLNEAGLFLITGRTGGGKTTLLDAMCMALYGKATGGKRTFYDMRNLSAAPETKTTVSYTFMLGEKTYTFYRSCFQRKKRGSEEFVWEDENYCTCDGKTLAAGASRTVTVCAEKLLSLTAEQFSQVIVLPQGKFMQLLQANSTEKAAILKTLFSCEFWERISLKFADRQKALYAKRETCENKLNSLLEKHGAETPEALAAASEAMRRNVRETGEALEAAQARQQTAQKQYTNALRFEQHEKAKREAAAAEQNARTRLQLAEKQYDSAVQNHAALPALNEEKSALLRRSERLLGEQKESAEKEALKKDLQLTENREKAIQKQADAAAARHGELLRRIAEGETYAAACDDAKGRLMARSNTLTELKNRRIALKTKNDAQALFAQCVAVQKAAKDKATKARLAVSAQDQMLAAEESKRNQSSAALLAAGLKDGTPCPVCGAVHHPAPARPCEGALSQEKLDALRETLEQLRAAQSKAEQAVAAAKARCEVAGAQSEAANEACGGITETEDDLARAYQDAEKALREDTALAEKAPRAREKLERLKAEADAAMKEKAQSDTDLAACRAALAEKQRQQLTMQAVRGRDEIVREMAEVQKHLTETEQKILTLNNEFSAAESRLAAAKEAFKSAEAQVNAVKAEAAALGTPPEKNSAACKAELDACNAQVQALSEALGQLNADLRSAEESLAAVSTYAAEVAELDRAYSRTAKLAGYLTGRGNAMHVPILQYVLGMMLDETIASANVFFSALSRGRYALQHKHGKVGSGFSGLNIEVLDAMSDSCRSVETLSGGEQFLASLSLAFGLSDVVQNYAGSVRLDSIFIDEGFGTLDSDTLDTAMRAIENIRRSGRVVGIISHVTELRSRIPAMIHITRNADGTSTARVISGE